MNRRRMSGHRAASSAPPAGPMNEIQTITVPNFVGATGYPFFAVAWPNYRGPDLEFGTSSGNLSGLTAAQAAAQFETAFNEAITVTDTPDKTVSVTGALDGTSLVLTVEFDGPGIAETNVDLGTASDWDTVGMPEFATVQDGSP